MSKTGNTVVKLFGPDKHSGAVAPKNENQVQVDNNELLLELQLDANQRIVVRHTIANLIDLLETLDFDFEDININKDLSLIAESIISLLCKFADVDHILQHFADETVTIDLKEDYLKYDFEIGDFYEKFIKYLKENKE